MVAVRPYNNHFVGLDPSSVALLFRGKHLRLAESGVVVLAAEGFVPRSLSAPIVGEVVRAITTAASTSWLLVFFLFYFRRRVSRYT
jgi:hypothetical protein